MINLKIAAACALTVTIAISAAGCSSNSSGGGNSSGGKPAAGHQTPASAMAGFIGNMLANHPNAACEYGIPAQVSLCTLGLSVEGKASGGWRIGNTATSGNKAIVDVEYANACMVGGCISNGNPNAGLPGSGLSFAAAFKDAAEAEGFAMACVRIDGEWYVDAGHGG
jgi:hypothetical protein